MAYIGHERSRGTLKYRCPARHGGWICPSDARCNGQRKYGLTVRVKQEIDLRRFPNIPRATKQFERLYAGRTAVERVNGRLKVFWGIDDGQVYYDFVIWDVQPYINPAKKRDYSKVTGRIE